MKRVFLKPLAMAVMAFTFSCSGAKENSDSTALAIDPAEQREVGATETELLANESKEVTYANIFTDVDNTQEYDVLALARTDDDLSFFVELVEKAGLESSLMVAEPVTVFIPTNEAFRQLSEEDYTSLTDPQNKDRLIKIIQTHIIPVEVPSKHFTNSKVIETASGEQIAVDVDGDGTIVKIGGADIVKADVEVSNGIIHVVDAVLDPRALSDVAID